jgi:hypothetical protein
MNAQEQIEMMNRSIVALAKVANTAKAFAVEGKTPYSDTKEWKKISKAFEKAQYTVPGLRWNELQELTPDEIQTLVLKQKEYQTFIDSIRFIK